MKPPHINVFYIESTTIKAAIQWNDTWQYTTALTPEISPKPASPLTSISWPDSDGEQVSIWSLYHGHRTDISQIRMYYLDNETRIIEFGGHCVNETQTLCQWFDAQAVVSSRVSNASDLAVVRWGNSTNESEIRVFYENVDGGLDIGWFSNLRWGMSNTPISVLGGSSLSAGLEPFPKGDVMGSIWYRGQDKNMYRRMFSGDNSFSDGMYYPPRSETDLTRD
jgi:hypothetical protein